MAINNKHTRFTRTLAFQINQLKRHNIRLNKQEEKIRLELLRILVRKVVNNTKITDLKQTIEYELRTRKQQKPNNI